MLQDYSSSASFTQLGTPPPLPVKMPQLPATGNQPVNVTQAEDMYLPAAELRKQYENYLFSKTWEIQEKRQSRRYYAGDQWTSDELKKLKLRNQPKVTRNRIKRKINSVVGLVERLRQDPKCYARQPGKAADADLATACIRYILDASRWEKLSSRVAADAAREGIGCIELGLRKTKDGDIDVTLDHVTTDTFFYDARSYNPDFGDCLYDGTAKWVDIEIAKNFCPEEKWPELEGASSTDSGAVFSEDGERAIRWMDSNRKRIRLVDQWYYRNKQWCWALYSYNTILMEGVSPFEDGDGQTISKFIAFSANVDPDGDRYGFVRDMKDVQDEMNHRYSKALHLLNTRRMVVRKGSINVEKTRQESVKSDGIIEYDGEKPEFDDAKTLADMQGQLKFLEDAKQEIENFGPNPQLQGKGDGQQSGRAIALLQQAGISELGPYITELKDWKLRVYRGVFCAARKHWSMERWIRVTGAQGQEEYVKINSLRYDPNTMSMQTVNSISAIDVNIIIDEGADTINMMQDTFDTLGTLAARGADVPPALLIELAPIDATIKKKWLEKLDQPPDPRKEKAQNLAIEKAEAEIGKDKSASIKATAEALKIVHETYAPPDAPGVMPLDQQTLGLADILENEVGENEGAAPMTPGGAGAAPGGPPGPPAGGPPTMPRPNPADQFGGITNPGKPFGAP